jgi:hypothetical protein
MAGVFALVLFSLSTDVLAQPFTYQGRLNNEGFAVFGTYDLQFSLFDAEIEGEQIGESLVFEDFVIENGLLTIDLNFGVEFDDSPKWLFIEVREGDSEDVFTGLSPRQGINPTPNAIHAMTATSATTAVSAESVLNPQWTEAPGVISYGTGIEQVLINRDIPINIEEFFGVHSTNTGFVGMFVSGPAESQPFYGYSVDNSDSTLTYYDVASGWYLVTEEIVALRVDENRNLIVTGETTASNFKFSVPQTRYTSVSGNSFHAGSDDVAFVSSGIGGGTIVTPGNGWLVSPVDLPHGATVTKMTAYCADQAKGSFSVSLQYQDHNGTVFGSVASVSSEGFIDDQLVLVDEKISEGLIDHTVRHYHIRVFSANWPGDQSLRISSVLIEYTIDEPN